MSKAEIVYEVQVREGNGFATFERVVEVDHVPGDEKSDKIDFTPLDEETDMRLVFFVSDRQFCHASPAVRERVRIRLGSVFVGDEREPDRELLEAHGFRPVPAS